LACLAGAAGVAGAVTGALLPAASPESRAPVSSRLASPRLPPPPRLGLHVPSPEALRDQPGLSSWAALRRPAVARASPRAGAPRVARLSARTPEGTTNLVLVLARRHDRRGGLWIRARLPTLDRRPGWIPRSAIAGYGVVDARLIVDRHRLQARLVRSGKVVFRAPVGIGKRGTPTPAGRFYVRDRVVRYASAFYGPVAFGTSARSATLTDWPGGGFIGIHGTDRPDLLPGRVSHGCIRMRNADIVRLARLMPVGTPLRIV
jgi:hypothetical protein